MKRKEYRYKAVSEKRGLFRMKYGMSNKTQAIDDYKNMVIEVEEEQGMSMNIIGIWDLRPECGKAILAEKIECCNGDTITLSLEEYEVND